MTHTARLHGRARRLAGHLAGLTAAAMLLTLAGPALPAQAAQTAEASDLTDGLALWYKLDAGSGTTVSDASGNGRDGTVEGTTDGIGCDGSATSSRSSTAADPPRCQSGGACR